MKAGDREDRGAIFRTIASFPHQLRRKTSQGRVPPLRAHVPTKHHSGAYRPGGTYRKEIVMNAIDIIETAETEAQSVTATICDNAALFGAAPERGEFDTREVWDADDAIAAVAESFRILSQGVAPDGFQLADERESLLWGFVNMLDAQTRRLDREADTLMPELRDLQRDQDGTEIRSLELELATDRVRNLTDRRDAFETNRRLRIRDRFRRRRHVVVARHRSQSGNRRRRRVHRSVGRLDLSVMRTVIASRHPSGPEIRLGGLNPGIQRGHLGRRQQRSVRYSRFRCVDRGLRRLDVRIGRLGCQASYGRRRPVHRVGRGGVLIPMRPVVGNLHPGRVKVRLDGCNLGLERNDLARRQRRRRGNGRRRGIDRGPRRFDVLVAGHVGEPADRGHRRRNGAADGHALGIHVEPRLIGRRVRGADHAAVRRGRRRAVLCHRDRAIGTASGAGERHIADRRRVT